MTSDRLQQLRSQLQTLRQQRDAGQIDDAAHDTRKAALERELLDLVVAGADAGTGTGTGTGTVPVAAAAGAPIEAPVRVPARLWGGIAAVALAIAAVGYVFTGAPQLLSVGPEASRAAAEAARAAEGAASAPMTMEQLATLTERLAERMKSEPDNAIGWGMLGRAYMLLQRPGDAVGAYAKAVALRRDDAQLLVDYADALASQQQGSLAGEPTRLIDEALKLDPNNLKVLSRAGAVAYERQDYARAVTMWERLIEVGQLSPELAQQVRSSIDEARRLGRLPPSAAASAPPTGSAGAGAPPVANAALQGTVTLAPALQAQVSPDDTVFVYARAADGPRMPLAIVRHQVRDLPLRFTLDDSQAMSPQMKLSAFPKVIVSARVSKSGDAIAQPGDLIGQTGPIAVGQAGTLQIEIRDTVGR